MAKIAFTEQAVSDIDEIAAYISLDSVHYASLQVTRIFTRSQILEQNAFIGRVVPELKMKSVREIFEGNYRIIYKIINNDVIHIITIYHSKRLLKPSDLKRLINRKNR